MPCNFDGDDCHDLHHFFNSNSIGDDLNMEFLELLILLTSTNWKFHIP